MADERLEMVWVWREYEAAVSVPVEREAGVHPARRAGDIKRRDYPPAAPVEDGDAPVPEREVAPGPAAKLAILRRRPLPPPGVRVWVKRPASA
ncbi:hypothetical protein [Aromatoleum aromaticum]|uniref:hypothetical protein n=1 Tax=Aromatoleum aromaticum TaxID=551760 RepID=UPI0002F870F6|nr:hypothetical protein [Aromatoleum aromaticum]NMG56163.1 hypothetical protein [Aromatoleum aromaticum]